jgi:pimeloyl-ACP methyl ester carboxylesterase
MTTERIHRTVSADGTEIASRVHGHGPPLVLVHGNLEDGELSWSALRPLLADRFTCYTMSTRCRDLSGEHPDLSPARLVEDVVAFADSVGEPVGLIGHSSGAGLVLGAAAQAASVAAVAAYEPVVPAVVNEEDVARVQAAMGRFVEIAGQGRNAEAARILFDASPIATDDEVVAMAALGHFDAMARYVPYCLQEMGQAAEAEQPDFSDPSVLGRITAPVLVLHGTRTGAWAIDTVRYLVGHLPDAEVREVPGAAHFAPLLAPETVAAELIRFFATVHPSSQVRQPTATSG